MKIHCSLCDLYLGEVKITAEFLFVNNVYTCPLCLELKTYVKRTIEGTLPQQFQWDLDVFAKNKETDDIIMNMLETRKLI